MPKSSLDPATVDLYPYRQTIRTVKTPRAVVLVAAVDVDGNFPETPIPHVIEGMPVAHFGSWRWLIAQRYVSGWGEAASGLLAPDPGSDRLTAYSAVADEIAERFGPGHDCLPDEKFGTDGSGWLAHVRRDTAANVGAYCGAGLTAPIDWAKAKQHCANCTTIYQAEHFGRHPMQEI